MKKILQVVSIASLSLLSACSTSGPKREFVDSSTHKDNAPSWVLNTKVTWEDGSKIMLKSSHTVRGDERAAGCYDLAKLDANESLLSELANDVKGRIDNASQSISENAETILGKVRKGEYEGRVTGLRFTDQYFERYRIGEVERIDCYTLAEITKQDYAQMKRVVVDKIVAVDPRIKEAVTQGQINFFADKSKLEDSTRVPAAATQSTTASDEKH